MTTPGLFLHSKTGNSYRVLFVTTWRGGSRPEANARIDFAADRDGKHFACVPYESNPLLTVLWSGNTNDVEYGDVVIIYVALYDGGRLSARTEREFEEMVDVPCRDVRGAVHRLPRFQRIGG